MAKLYKCMDIFFLTVDGQWGAWSGFSDCSVKCGNGTKTRTRSCDNPAPQYGGLKCAGNESEAIACSASDCAGTELQSTCAFYCTFAISAFYI